MMRPLAVSMGDPAGIGLEIAAKAWATHSTPAFVLVADRGALRRFAPELSTCAVASFAEGAARFGHALPVLELPVDIEATPGRPNPMAAPAIIAAIDSCVAAALAGDVSGIVTLPIEKASLYSAGFRFPGHTEYVAHLCADTPMSGTRGPVMMLATADLRVALVTIHEPLARVPSLLTVERVANAGRVTLEALRDRFGVANPRLAVAGLNPHAGEQGALGREEIEIINPAAAILRSEGWDVTSALPADTLFHADARAHYDAALCMYHDQALIPLKTIDFWGGVNLTLGLPIVRASPDHGVGFDIAGTNRARADSFIAALHLAHRLGGRVAP